MQRLTRLITKVAPVTGKQLKTRLKASARTVANEARQGQKRRTGELRRKTKAVLNRGSPAIVSTADHARINEFGGRHMLYGNRERWYAQPANPAIRTAVRRRRPQYLREAEQAIHVALREAGFT